MKNKLILIFTRKRDKVSCDLLEQMVNKRFNNLNFHYIEINANIDAKILSIKDANEIGLSERVLIITREDKKLPQNFLIKLKNYQQKQSSELYLGFHTKYDDPEIKDIRKDTLEKLNTIFKTKQYYQEFYRKGKNSKIQELTEAILNQPQLFEQKSKELIAFFESRALKNLSLKLMQQIHHYDKEENKNKKNKQLKIIKQTFKCLKDSYPHSDDKTNLNKLQQLYDKLIKSQTDISLQLKKFSDLLTQLFFKP